MNDNIITILRTNDNSKKLINFISRINSIKINEKEFQVDYILNQKSQSEVYSVLENFVIKNGDNGYNCTVFAYGQTGSGKTYTIQGSDTNPGIVPRILKCLHDKYKCFKLSFIEIYNENLVDLSNNKQEFLTIRDDHTNGVIVDNLNILETHNFETSIDFYKKGIKNRKTSDNIFNKQSSRSHSIFVIYLENEINGIIKKSRLTFVDLAGSEKLKDFNTSENFSYENPKQFKETTNINKSLLSLGMIVNSLNENEKKHISYRDSKLTFYLKDSLGGNSKLCIIGNINLEYSTDSINTLQFLQRAKMIKNKPKVNYEVIDENIQEALSRLEEENFKLKSEIEDLKKQAESGHIVNFLIKDSKLKIEKINDEFHKLKSNYFKLFDSFYNQKIPNEEINAKLQKLIEIYKKDIDFNQTL